MLRRSSRLWRVGRAAPSLAAGDKGGTGWLGTAKGAGSMHIRAVSPTDREFEPTGEIVIAVK
ncbi:MAG: hypothetical protein ACRDH5_15940 [bacterium]